MRNRTVILALFLLPALFGTAVHASEESVAAFLKSALATLPVTAEPCRELYGGSSSRTNFQCARPLTDFEGFRDAWEATVTDSAKVTELPVSLAEWQTQAGGRIRWYSLGDRWLVVTWDQNSRQVIFGYPKEDGRAVPLTRAVSQPRRLPINTTEDAQRREARVGLKADAQGLVVLHGLIGTTGLVEGVEVLGAVPRHRGLEEAATQAIRRWRYAPAVKDGQPVAIELSVTFTYGPGGTFRVWDAETQGSGTSPGLGGTRSSGAGFP
jgi:TonB family protein